MELLPEGGRGFISSPGTVPSVVGVAAVSSVAGVSVGGDSGASPNWAFTHKAICRVHSEAEGSSRNPKHGNCNNTNPKP